MLLDWDEPRQDLAEAIQANGVALRVIAITSRLVDVPPPWLLIVDPANVQEGLARMSPHI